MKKLISVGLSGFPRPSAETEKQKLIIKMFLENNYSALILCKKNFFTNDFPYKGEVEGINYFYTTYSFKKKKNKIENRLRQYFGLLVEKYLIFRYNPDIAVITSRSFLEILIYTITFSLIKTKTLLTHVEEVNSVESGRLFNKLNNYLFDRYAFRLVNASLPISEFLQIRIMQFAPNCPTFKLPVLVDYNKFSCFEPSESFRSKICFNYFLFCGSCAYKEVIDFIKVAYQKANVKSNLVFVLNGHMHEIEIIRNQIESERIIIFSDLEIENLAYLYKKAQGLLIPLRETIQDKARFPHKIGEYCAAGKVIITNEWGEISRYFNHLNNAYVCTHYNIEEYAKAFEFVENNPIKAKEIGANSHRMAKELFDYKIFSVEMMKFIESI